MTNGMFFTFDELIAKDWQILTHPSFDQFKTDKSELGQIKLLELNKFEHCDLQRKVHHMKPLSIPEKRLVLRFEQVDTEELKDIEI